jgi:hypothetical protein
MKYFTVDEANRTLPLVRRIVEDILTQHERWRELVREYEALAAHATPARQDPRLATFERDIQALAREIAGFVEELDALGVQFKGFDLGLVDYPSIMEGRPVFLCWRHGEPAVEHWHDVDAGYAGRRRIAPVALI